MAEVLEEGRGAAKSRDQTPSEHDLYEQIGRLHTERDWLKKNVNRSASLVRLIDRANPDIPVSRPCELLGLTRSNVYYKPVLPSPDEHSTKFTRNFETDAGDVLTTSYWNT